MGNRIIRLNSITARSLYSILGTKKPLQLQWLKSISELIIAYY